MIKDFSLMNNFDLKITKLGLHLKLKSNNYILLYDSYNFINLTKISNMSFMKKAEVDTYISKKKSATKDALCFALIKSN